MATKQSKVPVDIATLQEENLQLKAELEKAKPKKGMAPTSYLSEVISKDFELVNWVGGHRQEFGKFGVIDLTKLTPQRATSLIQRGFSKLKAKSK